MDVTTCRQQVSSRFALTPRWIPDVREISDDRENSDDRGKTVRFPWTYRAISPPATALASKLVFSMKASRWNRLVHRWGSILIALPAVCILLTGFVLQLKKQSSWIQPVTQRGSEGDPSLPFDQILEIAKSVPEAEIQSWSDIDRLDVRPAKGIVKVRARNRWEVQLDTASGDILQVAYRRSDLIESLHDGSFFTDWVKLGIFLPTAVVLIVLWGTGVYLFFLPHLAKRKKRLQRSRSLP